MRKPKGAPKPRQHSGSASSSASMHASVPKHRQHKKPAKPRKAPKPRMTGSVSKVRKWSPGADVACCSAEALGTLLGWDAARVLDLYWATANDPDEGASIEDTLEAAGAGLGASERETAHMSLVRGLGTPGILGVGQARISLAGLALEAGAQAGLPGDGSGYGILAGPAGVSGNLGAQGALFSGKRHALILGVELEEPHAIAVTPDGQWWSWGMPFYPSAWPRLVIEEAWVVVL